MTATLATLYDHYRSVIVCGAGLMLCEKRFRRSDHQTEERLFEPWMAHGYAQLVMTREALGVEPNA